MSYDFGIEIDTGGPEPAHLDPDFGEVAIPDRLRNVLANLDEPGGRRVAIGGAGFGANYTSNVSPMWARALTAALEQVPAMARLIGEDRRQYVTRHGRDPWAEHPPATKLGLSDLADQRCRELIDLLEAAVDHMIAKPEKYRPLNPENGWGGYEGALRYLAGIECWCRAHPDGRLYISH